jgi:hypothetical protein
MTNNKKYVTENSRALFKARRLFVTEICVGICQKCGKAEVLNAVLAGG